MIKPQTKPPSVKPPPPGGFFIIFSIQILALISATTSCRPLPAPFPSTPANLWPPLLWSCDPLVASSAALQVCEALKTEGTESAKSHCSQWDQDDVWRLRCEAFIDIETATGLDLGTQRSFNLPNPTANPQFPPTNDDKALSQYTTSRAQTLRAAYGNLSLAFSLAAAQRRTDWQTTLGLSKLSISLSLGDLDALSLDLQQLTSCCHDQDLSAPSSAALGAIDTQPIAALRLLNVVLAFNHPIDAPTWLAHATLTLSLHDDTDAALRSLAFAAAADPTHPQAAAALIQLSLLSGDCSRIPQEIQHLIQTPDTLSAAVHVWPSLAWTVLVLDQAPERPFDPISWPAELRADAQQLHGLLLGALDPQRDAWILLAKTSPLLQEPEAKMAVVCAVQRRLNLPTQQPKP